MREAMMGEDDDGNSLDRRIFLGASTATLLGLPGVGLAQRQRPSGPGKVSDLERAGIAFVDTVGVVLAGSQLPPADIVCDIIKLEGSAPPMS
jgi:hypothetical protein